MSGALFPGWRPGAAGRERLAALAAALQALYDATRDAIRRCGIQEMETTTL